MGLGVGVGFGGTSPNFLKVFWIRPNLNIFLLYVIAKIRTEGDETIVYTENNIVSDNNKLKGGV